MVTTLRIFTGLMILVSFTHLKGSEPATDISDPVALPELDDFRTVETPYYLIVGYDHQAVYFVSKMGAGMATVAGRYFELPAAFKPVVVVYLIPEKKAAFEAPYVLRVNARNEVSLAIKWGKQTAFSDVCEGLARAYLAGWAIETMGSQSLEDIPAWIELAFARELEAHFRPRYRDHFKRQAAGLPTLSLDQVIAPDSAVTEDLKPLALHAYWLFQCLKSEASSRGEFSLFLAAVLRGQETEDAIDILHRRHYEDKPELERWWVDSVSRAVKDGQVVLQTLEESRSWVERLSVLTVSNEESSEQLSFEKAWSRRGEPGVRQAIQWHLRETKLAIYDINPVYHNALHTLGRVYELMLTERGGDFWAETATFYEDYLRALELEKGITEALKARQ